MGNICRSPTAEAVFRHRAGDDPRWLIDSAGTHAYHAGEPPDHRAIAAASARGYDVGGIRARRVCADDEDRFG
ncbi:MAG: low molecular weight phosphotyrosine protein phosphatase, partial [Pseudomonadota bacterium]